MFGVHSNVSKKSAYSEAKPRTQGDIFVNIFIRSIPNSLHSYLQPLFEKRMRAQGSGENSLCVLLI